MTLDGFTGFLLLLFVFLVNPLTAQGSEQIPLDPSQKPRPAAGTLSAVVSDSSASRRCSLRLLPNGTVILARPCGLASRLDAVRRWRQDNDAIVLLDSDGSPYLVFKKSGGRTYKTALSGPKQLTLTLLPSSSIPLSRENIAD